MRFTFRAKLVAIVGTAAFAFVVLIVTSTVITERVRSRLTEIQERYVPRVELESQLEGQFETLRRGLQDAVAARDGDALDATRDQRNAILDRLGAARDVVDSRDAGLLRKAIEDYYDDAFDLSRRMISGETGEAIVESMASMQAKLVRAKELLKKTTAFDKGELSAVFTATNDALMIGGRLRLGIGVACLVSVTLLSLWLSRGVLRALGELTEGLTRFGWGEFAEPIRIVTADELSDVAQHANRMADNLRRLSNERDRSDWLKGGHAGLTQELRGELEPADVGNRAVRLLARYLDAPAAAVYYAGEDRAMRLLGQYALSGDAPEGAPVASFRPGEGLVGQAALQEDITVIHQAPAGYFRVRSGLGDASPRLIVLLPLVHLGKVRGVLELALFKPWTEEMSQLLLSVRETLTIAIEVARARAFMRDLLAETQKLAKRLAAQEEELQANNEELQAQQEELRQANDELTAQTEELERQRRVLQERNVELDDARRGLERKADELTKVSAYKSQFLANMSHELRTPLNSMLLLSNLLVENETGNLTARQVEFCRTIYSAGKDLLDLINQVLDLAKVESGKQTVTLDRVELHPLIGQLQRVFEPLASDKGLRFEVDVASGVPEVLTTDAQRVQQILTNLLANAIKFTEKGEVRLRIFATAPTERFDRVDLRADRAVALAVSDTGVGIAPEHQQRIFVPFEQVDSATDRRYGGTGLGLSIARELAHLLGGELRLESALGKGSTFTCYLPTDARKAAADARPRGAAASGSSVAPVPQRRPANGGSPAPGPSLPATKENSGAGHVTDPYLLMIEDDPIFADAVGTVVRAQGLAYASVPDGKTGLLRAKEHKPRGIILDVKLPDVDGWTIMEQLRSDPQTSDIPVHFISAVDAAERAMAMGAIGYLTKPATVRDLVRVVESLVPRSSERSYRVLVVEDDGPMGDSVVRQLMAEKLEAKRVGSAGAALEAIKNDRYGCIILDLSLPDMDGLDLLRSLQERYGSQMPAVVVYTARALSKLETQRLEEYAEAVVLKDGPSVERVVDEVRLFVRRLKEGLGPRRTGAMLAQPTSVRLEGRKILVADDDMRTVYALSATLRAKGAEVFVADTGRAALNALGEHPDVDAVLMDIMMPEMDGYEAIKRIRKELRFEKLPVIALTAKAMKDDRQRCLDAGATDYLPKPIDPDRLLCMIDARLKRSDDAT